MEEEFDLVHFGMTDTVIIPLNEEWCNLCNIFIHLH